MQEKELWKSVGMFRGIDFSSYESSTFGNVRSIDRDVKYKDGRIRKYKGTVLSKYKNRHTGYMQVILCHKGKPYTIPVHELIMNAHNPNPNPEIYTDINHIDEDKTNNRLSNLEWTTHKENCNHGTSIERMAQRLRDKFIPIVQLDFDGNIINVYYSTKEINRTMVYNVCAVIDIISKQNYIYKNYFWIRLDEYNNLEKENLIELIREKTTIKEMKAHKSSNKPIMQFSKNGEFIREHPSIVNAAKEIGCTKQAIQQCASGKCKTCKGYKWKYK